MLVSLANLYFFQALDILSDCQGSIPTIFLVTDGTVEDEKHICDVMKSRIKKGGSLCPRIFTFGIGNGSLYSMCLAVQSCALLSGQ